MAVYRRKRLPGGGFGELELVMGKDRKITTEKLDKTTEDLSILVVELIERNIELEERINKLENK